MKDLTSIGEDYRNRKGRRTDLTAPDVPRTKHGSVIWPTNSRAAWYQLCDLARCAPDNRYFVDELIERLRYHGESTQRKTVERIFKERP